MEVTKKYYESLMEQIFGSNYSSRLGRIEDNRLFGKFWTYPGMQSMDTGERTEIPITWRHIHAENAFFSGVKTEEELRTAISEVENAIPIGLNMTERSYLAWRIANSILLVHTVPDLDGWHDWEPNYIAKHLLETEKKARTAILKASLWASRASPSLYIQGKRGALSKAELDFRFTEAATRLLGITIQEVKWFLRKMLLDAEKE